MFKEFACARVNTNIFLVFVIVGRKCVMPFFTLYLKYLRLTSLEVGVIRGSQSWVAMILIPIWLCFVKRSKESIKTRVLLLISVFLTASMYSCLVFVPPIGGAYDVTHCDSVRSRDHELVVGNSDSLEHGSDKFRSKESDNISNLASSTFSSSSVSKSLSEHNSNNKDLPMLVNVSSKENIINGDIHPTSSDAVESKNNFSATLFSNQVAASVDKFSEIMAPTKAEPSILGKVQEFSSEESSWRYEPYFKLLGQVITDEGKDALNPHRSSFPSAEKSEKYPAVNAFKSQQKVSPISNNDFKDNWSFGKIEGREEKPAVNGDAKAEEFLRTFHNQDTDEYSTDDDLFRLPPFVKSNGGSISNGLYAIQKPYLIGDRMQGPWETEMNGIGNDNLNKERKWGKNDGRKQPRKKKIHVQESDDESVEDNESQSEFEWNKGRGKRLSKQPYNSRIGRSLLSDANVDVVVSHGRIVEDSGPLAFRTVLMLSGLAELFACMPVPMVTTLWWLHLDDAEHTEQFGEHRLYSLLALVPAVLALVVAISQSPCSLLLGPHQISLHLLAAATVLLSSIPLIFTLPLVPASKAWRRSSETPNMLSHRGYISSHQIFAVLTTVLSGIISATAGEYVLWHVDTISGFPFNYELIYGGCVAVGALVEALFTAVFRVRCCAGLNNLTGSFGLILMSVYLVAAAITKQVWVFVILSGLMGAGQALLFRAQYGVVPGPGDVVSAQRTGWRFGYGIGCFLSGFIGEIFGMKILLWSAAGAASVWAIISACCYK
ncbi:hypothetical protein J437_LFUL017930 [Ladona fulva]|uniref:Major facilitator superfamily associated domain-containing protein n=1 Tax=Ladona fulva TaxID=123851 RepID=A0A8K0KQL1_LADFU|nr:hypothetical protein J437_LFUL017930 [Ladona fulva]